MAEPDHTQRIRAAQVRVLYEQSPWALTATGVNAVILVAILWEDVSHPLLTVWLLIVFLVVAGRYTQTRAYLRTKAPESRGWERHFLYGVAINGVLWGFAGFFFFPSSSYVHQVFIAFVLVGMVSGGVSTLSPVRGAYLLFLIPALLPYAVRLVSAGNALHLAMSGMLVLYVISMTAIGRRVHATVAESFRLRFENVDLLHDLTQAKERQELANQELAAQVAEKLVAQIELQKAYAELERRVQERTEKLSQSEEALRDADRRKDEFLAMLGHELRNPLAPIRNALHIMRKPSVSESVLEWGRDLIDRQIDHLTRLVDDLLDVSRIVRGKISLQETVLDISAVVDQAVEASRPLIDARRHELSLCVTEKPLWVRGDLVRLAQAVSNLLNNAAKYTDSGGHIYLNVEPSEQWITVSVRDNGIGIPAEQLPYIFDLFAQANHGLDRKQGGLGIGLTLVKRLVEMHGGRVEARSKGPGRGSEFFLHLPRHFVQVPQETPMKETVSTGWETPLRVLVVDDNQDAADTLATLMRLEGHEVAVAFDGPGALSESEKMAPQVVLLDIGMPVMDGYQVARELRSREQTKSSVILALSGYGQPDDRARSKEAGFDDHLTKPIEPQVLMTVLKTHLSRIAGRTED